MHIDAAARTSLRRTNCLEGLGNSAALLPRHLFLSQQSQLKVPAVENI